MARFQGANLASLSKYLTLTMSVKQLSIGQQLTRGVLDSRRFSYTLWYARLFQNSNAMHGKGDQMGVRRKLHWRQQLSSNSALCSSLRVPGVDTAL